MPPKLCATGVVSIVMVMNLKRFISDSAPSPFVSALRRYLPGWLLRWFPAYLSSVERFEQARGSSAYAEFLRQLRPTKWFEVDRQEMQVELHGHELSTFRQYLVDTYFFPTYRLTDNNLALTTDAVQLNSDLASQLKQWDFKVR